MIATVKLPKGVKVYGFSGKAWRGEIPVTDCPDFIADKYAQKSAKKNKAVETG
jgi:hypothetical protein